MTIGTAKETMYKIRQPTGMGGSKGKYCDPQDADLKNVLTTHSIQCYSPSNPIKKWAEDLH